MLDSSYLNASDPNSMRNLGPRGNADYSLGAGHQLEAEGGTKATTPVQVARPKKHLLDQYQTVNVHSFSVRPSVQVGDQRDPVHKAVLKRQKSKFQVKLQRLSRQVTEEKQLRLNLQNKITKLRT